MIDKAKIKGEFRLKVFRKGKLVENIRERNLIVDSGFELVQQLLSSAAADKHISKIAFGNLASGEPVQPTAASTTVPGQFLQKGFATVTFPTTRSVSFNWSMEGNEGNGNNVAYFGLQNDDNELFAAKARPAIVKTEDIVLEGTWIIHY
jgi:hypothetical protein